jgi:predicted RNA-binding protein associated with RNAse of E/G family
MAELIARSRGEVAALRYLTTDGRIEMCWPSRVVEDSPTLLALFVPAGTKYKAGPKRTAAEKLSMQRVLLPPDEYVWRADMLRLMFPGRQHSVWLFWANDTHSRRFSSYFVNMEEPFRRTAVGFDTQDHTLDINVAPDLTWKWRDTESLDEHVKHGFYTDSLASEVWNEARRAIGEIERGEHACLKGWCDWLPDPGWTIPEIPPEWSSEPVALWEKHFWAYGRLGGLRRR